MKVLIDERFFRSIDEQFIELLSRMPKHWFSEINSSVRVMDQISYALYQAFCLTYGYEMGKFDVASKENRITGYIIVIIKDKNGKNKKVKQPVYSMWGRHPDDWKILLPIYKREKEKYLNELKNKENV